MYCTRTDLENRFGTDTIADLEYGKPSAVDEAIADASSQIDTYIGARYSLPLATVPSALRQVARDLVRYQLDVSPNEVVRARRDDAINYLLALSQGKATLGVSQSAEPESLDTAEIQSHGSVFSRPNSKGFI